MGESYYKVGGFKGHLPSRAVNLLVDTLLLVPLDPAIATWWNKGEKNIRKKNKIKNKSRVISLKKKKKGEVVYSGMVNPFEHTLLEFFWEKYQK